MEKPANRWRRCCEAPRRRARRSAPTLLDRYFEGPEAYYVGRKYRDGSTEIISKGLEAMYDDPAGFAKADPDYFDFMVDILAGAISERQASG